MPAAATPAYALRTGLKSSPEVTEADRPHRVHGRVSHHRLPYGQSSYLSTSTEEVGKGTAREEADHRPCYGIENYALVLPRPAGGSRRVLSGNRRSGQDKPVQGSGVGLLATPFTYIEAAVPWGAKQ